MSDEVVLTFRCNGPQATWDLTGSKVREWQEIYPGLDVLAECKKARQWEIDNPRRRKTANGHSRYLINWLSKAQDKAGQNGHSPPPTSPRLSSRKNEFDSLTEAEAVIAYDAYVLKWFKGKLSDIEMDQIALRFEDAMLRKGVSIETVLNTMEHCGYVLREEGDEE